MNNLSKAQKIRISLTFLWGLMMFFTAVEGAQSYSSFDMFEFLAIFTFLNIPVILYWLGVWIWGEGYLGRFFLSLKSKIKGKTSKDSLETVKVVHPNNHKNYFLKHWHGEHSLVRSYWINSVLFSAVFSFCLEIVIDNISVGEQIKLFSYLIIFMWLTIAVITVWQLVGVWRSSTIYSRQSQKIWGGVTRFFTIMGAIVFINLLFSAGIPQVKEYLNIATGNDPIGDYKLRVLNNSTELELSGYIGFGVTKDVEEYLKTYPAVNIIHLNSGGGRLNEARKLADLIEANALSTYAATECVSACILPFAAGKERLINRRGVLGFHQYGFPGLDGDDFKEDYIEDKAYLRSKGIKENFLKTMFREDHDDMWEPSHKELFDANFITKYPETDEVAVSGYDISELDNIEKIFLDIPIYKAISENKPEAYQVITKAVRDGMEKGQTIAEMRKTTFPVILKILYESLPYTSDQALLNFTETMIGQLSYLRNIDPNKCYQYAFAQKDSIDVSIFPKEILDKEVEATALVIKNYDENRLMPTQAIIENDMLAMFLRVQKIHGDDTWLISEEKHLQSNWPVMCDVTIDLYKEIMTENSGKAATLLRYMFAQ